MGTETRRTWATMRQPPKLHRAGASVVAEINAEMSRKPSGRYLVS